MVSFWKELRRRKVVRVVTAYAVVSWVLVEVVVSLEEPLGLPDWTDTLVIVLLGIGFFVAAVLAWAYELTPDGIERAEPRAEDLWAGGSPVGRYAFTAVGASLMGAAVVWLLTRDSDEDWLRQTALPEVDAALSVGDWQSAFMTAVEIEQRLPGAPELSELWPRMAWTTSIRSDPPGATVFRRPYAGSDDSWQLLGQTPLEDIRFPYALSELRFELEGYRSVRRTGGGGMVNLELPELLVRLEPESSGAEGKVLVPGWNLAVGNETVSLHDFHLDAHEVTNAEFKAFVDAGGYERPSLWPPIVVEGDTLSFEEGIGRLKDATGRTGPSGWEAGDYPPGEDDHPVQGVSWYEAMAYARFVGEELPSAQHWWRSLNLGTLRWQLPESNFDGAGARAVSESRAMSYTGAFDLAGNVREWTSTPLGAGYVILGGSYTDPYYVVGVRNTSAPPWDRSPGNGFRLAITTDDPSVAARVRALVPEGGAGRYPIPNREPVDDAVFAAYGSMFDYERGPLNDTIEEVDESRSWRREVVSFDAGYRGERMRLFLYLPTVGSPPYQTVIFWPGWDTFRAGTGTVDHYFSELVDYIVRDGRALAFPVYSGTFERGDGNGLPPFGSSAYRDNTVDGVKDLRRTLDYLETRPDIDARSFAYYGYSWGGVNGPIALTREDRLKVGVVYVGGSPDLSATPEVDPVNALPRVEVPVLLFSGEFDTIFPIENARHYFELLGSEQKRHVVTQGAHFVPRNELIRESLAWLDLYLGDPSR